MENKPASLLVPLGKALRGITHLSMVDSSDEDLKIDLGLKTGLETIFLRSWPRRS